MNTLTHRVYRPISAAFLAISVGFSCPAPADQLPTFQLTARNGHFSPETIEAPAGMKFRIAIKNEGSGPEEFESPALRKESVIAPGITRTLVFAPMSPGIYPFFSDFHPETAKGQIIVK